MVDITTGPKPASKPKRTLTDVKDLFSRVGKAMASTVTLLAEIAIVGVVGSQIGSYISAKTIVDDCRRVSMAKVGDMYVTCKIVEPQKDAADKPPR